VEAIEESATSAIPRCLWIREIIVFVPALSLLIQLGDYARAMQFLQLDAGTEWSSENTEAANKFAMDKISERNNGKLRTTFPDVPWGRLSVLLAWHHPASEDRSQRRHGQGPRLRLMPDPDPEVSYGCSRYSSVVAERVADGICSRAPSPSLLHLSGLQKIPHDEAESTPEFAEVVSAAKKCRDDFMAERDR